MRLLFLTFYYPPDLSAGSFRAESLVRALRARIPAGSSIDVLTTLPNRYHSFVQKAPAEESAEGIEIRRFPLPSHRSDMWGQARAFSHFGRQVLRYVRDRQYDLVFATSSRLMTAALGRLIARRKGSTLYLDIRDIFVDTIKDVLPPLLAWPARYAFSLVESWTMRRATRINLVSRGFEDYFRARYEQASLAWFTNGIDDEFLSSVTLAGARVRADRTAMVVYAGNVGEGQALHTILPGLATALRGRARFIVIGDGGRRAQLDKAITGLDNVELRSPVSRAELLKAYQAADVLFLHLGAHPAFEKVLPSKLFEYGAMGKPVLAGVSGYAARFVQEEITNAAVFAPGDVRGAVAAFESLKIEDLPRAEFVARYARAHIAGAMADDIIAAATALSSAR